MHFQTDDARKDCTGHTGSSGNSLAARATSVPKSADIAILNLDGMLCNAVEHRSRSHIVVVNHILVDFRHCDHVYGGVAAQGDHLGVKTCWNMFMHFHVFPGRVPFACAT